MEQPTGENLSIAFEELGTYRYVEKGMASTFTWYHLYNPNDQNRSEVLLREYSSPETVMIFLEEVNAYQQLKNDAEKSSQVKIFQAPILKYALKKNSQSAEVLQAYCGNPITNFYQRLKEPNENLQIQFMEKLLRDCAVTLNEAKIFHGNLCPDNITFDNGRSKVRFQGGHSVRFLEPTKKDYILKFKSIYYSLSDFSKPMSASNAKTADIKALALSIFEFGLTAPPFLITDSLYTSGYKVNLDKLLNTPNHVLNQAKSNTSAQKLKTILNYILTTANDLTYEYITEKYSTEINPTYVSGTTFKPDTDKLPFETDIKYNPKTMKIRKYNANVYKIEYFDPKEPSFIIKKYAKELERDRDIAILKKVEDGKASTLIKRKMNHKAQFEKGYSLKELLIEFNGLTFQERLKYSVNDNTLIKKILSAIDNIMEDLLKLQIFHCDIKPVNISINDSWNVKLFDYDVSVIEFEPKPNSTKSLDDTFTFNSRGASVDYSAPELLKLYLDANPRVTLNPYRADLYSLGKTVICTITHNFTQLDVLNNLYELNCQNQESLIECIKAKLTEEERLECEKAGLFTNNNDKLLSRFYIKYNNTLIKNVMAYNYTKADTSCKVDEYKDIMKFLATLVATNPNDRPDIEKLRQYSFEYLGKSTTFKLQDLFATHISNKPANIGEFDIIYIEKLEESISIDPEFSSHHGYYQPIVNEDKTTFDIYNVKIEQPTLTYKKCEKIATNISYISLSKFIQCVFKNEGYPKLFMIGGCDDFDAVNKVSFFDKTKFENAAPMEYARYEFGALSWQNFIAVAGGRGSSMVNPDVNEPYLNIVEIYDVAKNTWTKATGTMKKARKNSSMAFGNGNLYIIGGIEFINEEIKEDASPKPFHSKDVDIFSVRNSTAQFADSFIISTQIFNGICDCISLVKSKSEIIIFKDYLLQRADNSDYIVDSKYILDITKKTISRSTEEETPYTAYSCCNCLHFKDVNICIPQFMESTFPAVESEPKQEPSVGHSLLNLTTVKIEMIDFKEN